jgi:hypothetical protein
MKSAILGLGANSCRLSGELKAPDSPMDAARNVVSWLSTRPWQVLA